MDEAGIMLVAAYQAGELDADGVTRLEAWLRADPSHQRYFAREARLSAALRDEVAARQARHEAGISAPRRHLRYRVWLAAAAGLLLALGGWLLLPATPAARLDQVAAGTRLERAGADLPVTVGLALAPGDRLRGPLRLGLADGTGITLDPDANLGIAALDPEPRFTLAAGRLHAEVAQQRSGSRLRITTAEAEVAVIGTRFTVEAEAGATRVRVENGQVRIGDHRGQERMVGPGEAAWISADGLQGRVLTVVAADTPAGLAAGAFTSLQAAVDAARPGDEVRLLPGRHHGRPGSAHTAVRCQGAPTRRISITSEPGARVVSAAWDGLQLKGSSWLRLNGLIIEPDPAMPATIAGNGIALVDTHHVIVANCMVRDMGGDGIVVLGSDHVRIAGNTIIGCAHRSDFGQGGIAVNASRAVDAAPGPHIVIEGNRISGSRRTRPNSNGGKWTGGNGIGVYNHLPGLLTPDNPGFPHAIRLVGNLCHGNDGAGAWIYASPTVRLERNLFHGNGRGRDGNCEIGLIASPGVGIDGDLLAPRSGCSAVMADRPYSAIRGKVWNAAGGPGLDVLTVAPWLMPVLDEDARSDFRLRPGLEAGP